MRRLLATYLVGDYKNGGREYQPEGCPEETGCYDFKDKILGKAIPYGIGSCRATGGMPDPQESMKELHRRPFHVGAPLEERHVLM